jgi:hypothetical protein
LGLGLPGEDRKAEIRRLEEQSKMFIHRFKMLNEKLLAVEKKEAAHQDAWVAE